MFNLWERKPDVIVSRQRGRPVVMILADDEGDSDNNGIDGLW